MIPFCVETRTTRETTEPGQPADSQASLLGVFLPLFIRLFCALLRSLDGNFRVVRQPVSSRRNYLLPFLHTVHYLHFIALLHPRFYGLLVSPAIWAGYHHRRTALWRG